MKEHGIRAALILCTWLLGIQTTQLSPFLHNQGEIVWTCCVWEIQVSISGFELEFSPPQLNALPLSYDAPYINGLMDYECEAKWTGMLYLLQAKGDYARARSYAVKYLLAVNRSIFSPLNTQAKTIHDENVLFWMNKIVSIM